MNCELIFYLATKTNLCEKALESRLKHLDLCFQPALFATEPETTNIAFIIGGLSSDEKNGIKNILSKALASKSPDDLKKLKNPLSGADGYLVRQGGQLLVVLPDEPGEIEEILDGPLNPYLESFIDF